MRQASPIGAIRLSVSSLRQGPLPLLEKRGEEDIMEIAIMHPAGIKFGLAHGLLEFSGATVVLSPPVLESISEMARRKVRRRKRVIWIWDEAVAAGLRKMLFKIDAPRQEDVPFYTGLDRVIFETMGLIAEKAKKA